MDAAEAINPKSQIQTPNKGPNFRWQMSDQCKHLFGSAGHISGEHRLPACSFRQLAEKRFWVFGATVVSDTLCRRHAADNCRLAACAPQIAR
jgi:hypothetical protein